MELAREVTQRPPRLKWDLGGDHGLHSSDHPVGSLELFHETRNMMRMPRTGTL